MNDMREQSQAMARNRTGVSSSARDPIDRWLDVFVRLLRVPRADAKRIRDELEDHLRARVDDLMLTGHAELEAVRAAVAELGETAELARQFQTASKPHRRLTMLAGSAIVSAGLITGAVLLTQTGAPPASSQQTGAIATASAEPAENAPVFSSDLVADSETGFARLGDAVQMIEELLDSRVIAHYRYISEPGGGAGAQDDIAPLPLKGLTLEQGLEQLTIAVHLPEGEELAVYKADNAYELAPQSFFDERDAVLIEYDVSELLYPPAGQHIEPQDFASTVTSLIEPDLWGVRARLGMVSTTMLVNAHPRIHDQITDLFARIEARYEQQREAQRAERRAELESRLAQHMNEIDGYNRRIAEFEQELEEARQARRTARERIYRLEVEANGAVDEEIIGIRLDLAEAQDELQATESHMRDVSRHLDNMKQSLAFTKGQISAVEAQLVSLGDPASTPNSVFISGEVDRPGAYAVSSGLTARRAAATAGADPDAVIEISRADAEEARVLDAGEDAQLRAGDLLRLR